MNYRTVINVIGKVLEIEALLLLLPLIVTLIYKEDCTPFVITIVAALLIGAIMDFPFRDSKYGIQMRDGYAIVALTWLMISLVGCLPFIISREIPNFFNAFFETVSGFTTTGASILNDVEALSKGMLFWRSFTHWIGGMGVIVFVMAISISTSGSSSNMLRAEIPGHSFDKLVPKTRRTVHNLYFIYFVMTVIEIALLAVGGMPIYDSIIHSLGTAGTGGFGIKADSLASYSAYSQWIIAIFMMLFGVNFGLYYLILKRRGRSIFESNELKWYLIIMLASTIIVGAWIYPQMGGVEETLRTSFFQVSSIMTTTGYSTVNFDLWPNMAKTVLLLLMLVGGCIGSTAGGIKVSRIVVLAQSMKNHMKIAFNPRQVTTIKLNGRNIDREEARRIEVYVLLYITIALVAFFIISFEPFSFETNFTAVVACIGNIGPGFAGVGPAANFAEYSWFSKLVLSTVMLVGRLEIYPVIMFFVPIRRRLRPQLS